MPPFTPLLSMRLPLRRSFHRLSVLFIAVVAIALWTIAPPPAQALTSVQLEDVAYRPCPPEMAEGTVSPGGVTRPAKCFLVYGIANNTSGKPVIDADVFGRIYDADNNPTMENRTRVGAIEEIPPGRSEFSFRISVPATQPEPLQLKQFKASGFTGKVRR
jgi:hypothetical protein